MTEESPDVAFFCQECVLECYSCRYRYCSVIHEDQRIAFPSTFFYIRTMTEDNHDTLYLIITKLTDVNKRIYFIQILVFF